MPGFRHGWAVGNHIATSIVSVVRTPSASHRLLLINLRQSNGSARGRARAIVDAADVVVLATVRTIRPKYAVASTRGEFAERWCLCGWPSIRCARAQCARPTPAFAAFGAPRGAFRNITILARQQSGTITRRRAHSPGGRCSCSTASRVAPTFTTWTTAAFVPNDQNIRDVADAALPVLRRGRVFRWNRRTSARGHQVTTRRALIALVMAMTTTGVAHTQVRVVNMIPRHLSDETFQNAEPTLAVNPNNPAKMAASAYAPGGDLLARRSADLRQADTGKQEYRKIHVNASSSFRRVMSPSLVQRWARPVRGAPVATQSDHASGLSDVDPMAPTNFISDPQDSERRSAKHGGRDDRRNQAVRRRCFSTPTPEPSH
jgi:hypothetical protein